MSVFAKRTSKNQGPWNIRHSCKAGRSLGGPTIVGAVEGLAQQLVALALRSGGNRWFRPTRGGDDTAMDSGVFSGETPGVGEYFGDVPA